MRNLLKRAGDPLGVGASASAGERNPRTSNTGVVFTNTALIDWLAFTVPTGAEGVEITAADLVLRVCGEPDVPALERGAMGYTHGFRLPGSGVILYNPQRPDMGIHCSLPSGALALCRKEPKELIALVLSAGGKFTRVDVALDTDKTHISVVFEAIQRGDLVSRSVQRTYQGSFVDDGYTIYIGARSSDRFVRIYNKAAEQKIDDGRIWTRAEVEFKKGQAQIAAAHIYQGIDLRSLVFSAIDFRDRAADTNTSRCPRLDWWGAWVGVVERVSFAVETLEKTVKQVYDWVVRQCAPSLAFLDKYLGKNTTWLYELCDTNSYRIPNGRLKLIEETPLTKRMIVSELTSVEKRHRRPDNREGHSVDYLGVVDRMKEVGVSADDWGLHLAFA